MKKAFFDWFRKEMGGRLSQTQVDYANQLLRKMSVARAKLELLKKYKPQKSPVTPTPTPAPTPVAPAEPTPTPAPPAVNETEPTDVPKETSPNDGVLNVPTETPSEPQPSEPTTSGSSTSEPTMPATTPEPPKEPEWHMHLSDKGFDMLAVFEGFRSKPYRDSVGIPTIGYGNTYYLDGRKVKMTDPPITKEEAKQLKMAVINKDFAPAVNRLLETQIKAGKVTQNMFDALISLGYNIGVEGLAGSSVIRYIKNGNKQKAGDAFLLWKNAGGRPILLSRRKQERSVFLA